jgi:endonuclease/exonuclease/phosphatase family metal-dependent hydrolase
VDEFLKDLHFFEIPHVIVGGDFNATEDEPSIKKIKMYFKDAGKNENTWSLENDLVKIRSNRRIDYIFCSENVLIEDTRLVLNKKNIMFPSDHYGVYAELSI